MLAPALCCRAKLADVASKFGLSGGADERASELVAVALKERLSVIIEQLRPAAKLRNNAHKYAFGADGVVPSTDPKSAHTTPAHHASTSRQHITPAHHASTSRQHTTPAHHASTPRQHITPAHHASTSRQHTTPPHDPPHTQHTQHITHRAPSLVASVVSVGMTGLPCTSADDAYTRVCPRSFVAVSWKQQQAVAEKRKAERGASSSATTGAAAATGQVSGRAEAGSSDVLYVLDTEEVSSRSRVVQWWRCAQAPLARDARQSARLFPPPPAQPPAADAPH
jgi:hypothetical protein